MSPVEQNNPILRLARYLRSGVPPYAWVFAGIVVLAVIVGTTGALQLKKSIKVQSKAQSEFPAKVLPPSVVKAAPKVVVKPTPQPRPPASEEINLKPILPESDVATDVAEPKAYEEALPEKVFEPTPVTVAPIQQEIPKTEPVVVAPGLENSWRKNAVQLAELPPGPKIAIVIDDAGVDRKRTAAVTALPAPLTIAFLTYAGALPKQTKAATAAGHEIMVHMAMEPLNRSVDPGPNVLLIESEAAEILKRLRWGLDRFSGYVGINNHMGSKFTSDPQGMNIVMRELKRRGLLFLDSRTSGSTVGASVALANDVPFTQRNIFLDNVPTVEAINKQLRQMEIFAKRNGYAVAIGHPRDATINALSQWLAVMAEKGFVQVPISTIVAQQRQ
ncbi:MAG: divergent polysaccharide deacetylase family protein [Rhodospirillaceae bacterium]|nr:divergent polysaccharide deacetylase family protein [Rhodospirillaceae bacterium]MBT4588883.1 divergent polysaccharide deacetylase family protein [Rhodospirillaceae bacterium]MBT5938516.1 divergent polysaccharide deacetylase family protein [Rhodospirillaceae bacterium]MBT7265836.1 divergent polysaccharide deacetylase family protein [Rhodospirillaceae bacterium]